MQRSKYSISILVITFITAVGLFGCSDSSTGPGGDGNDLSESEQAMAGSGFAHIYIVERQ